MKNKDLELDVDSYLTKAEKPNYYYTQRFISVIYWLLSKFWYRLEVVGLEHLQSVKKPFIIVGNHKSNADPFFLFGSLPVSLWPAILPIRGMAKDSLFRNSLSQFFARSIGTFPSYYGQGLDISLKTPCELLKNGEALGIYPEGKRVYGDEMGKFKKGIGEIAEKNPNVPIVPILTYCSEAIAGEALPKFRGKVKVVYGAPFFPELTGNAQATADEIQRKLLDIYKKNYR